MKVLKRSSWPLKLALLFKKGEKRFMRRVRFEVQGITRRKALLT
jgi:hypothetical protein